VAKNYDWEAVRALWEAGAKSSAICKEDGMPSRAGIDKRAKREGWTRDLEPQIRRKVAEKVAGFQKVAKRDPKKLADAVDAEAERRAAVERKHRDEPEDIRDMLKDGIKAHNTAETKEDKTLAFADLKAAKISSEVMANIHAMERKAYRMDDVAEGAGDDVAAVLKEMADKLPG